MTDVPLHYATIVEQAEQVRSRAISPVELTRTYLGRIEHLDARLGAFITVLSDQAVADAREAERAVTSGGPVGPLHGIPVALKDIIHMKGVPTTAGSRVMDGFVPQETSALVRRLSRAGAIVIGKANLSEFAIGGTVDHPFGTPRNPWGLDRTPGGSSSGSAVAVAAGLCSAALGSDTGGSIRGPASFCGTAGIRPTYGRVTRQGVVPMCWSMDTVGPMTRTVEDCAIVLEAVAGHEDGDVTSSRTPVPDYRECIRDGVRGLRVGLPREMFDFDGLDPEVGDAVRKAVGVLEGLGASWDELSLPTVPHSGAAFIAVADTDAAAFHSTWLRSTGDDYDWNTRTRLEAASLLPASAYIKAQRARSLMRRELLEALDRFDVLLGPASNRPAPSIESATGRPGGHYQGQGDMARRRLTSPASLAGLPALSVPCGFSGEGLPIGFQLIGKPFDEATLFRVGHAYESATGWHAMHPEL